MPRGAAVVYPKDAAQIVAMADIFPGARRRRGRRRVGRTHLLAAARGRSARPGVVLRAARGVRRRRRANVTQFFGGDHPAWRLTLGDLAEELPASGRPGRPGHPRHARPLGVPGRRRRRAAPRRHRRAPTSPPPRSCRRFVETVRLHGGFTEPQAWESLVRDWHVEGLAVRPGHSMIGHTAFLVTARRMAPGQRPPAEEAPSGARRVRPGLPRTPPARRTRGASRRVTTVPTRIRCRDQIVRNACGWGRDRRRWTSRVDSGGGTHEQWSGRLERRGAKRARAGRAGEVPRVRGDRPAAPPVRLARPDPRSGAPARRHPAVAVGRHLPERAPRPDPA